MDNQKPTLNLRFITICFVFLSTCFLVFASSKFYTHYNYAKYDHPVHKEAAEAVEFLEGAMKLPLWNISRTLAEPTFQIFEKAYPDVSRASITNALAAVFMEMSRDQSNIETGLISMTRAITYEGDLLGHATVWYKPVNPIAYAWNKISLDVLYFFIQLAALAFFSWIFLFRKPKAKSSVEHSVLKHS